MTRVNCVDVSFLTDAHLIAEWREIVRIPNCLSSGKYKYVPSAAPKEYTLGTGHCRFFYNKLLYIQTRHHSLCQEMDARKIRRNIEIIVDLTNIDNRLCNEWEPSVKDKLLNSYRLLERYDLRKKDYKIRGLILDNRGDMIELLNQACDGLFVIN